MAYKWRINGVYGCKKGSTFAANLKVHKMNPISITGTIAAALNYKSAKNEYDALIEQKEALKSSVQLWNNTKYDELVSKLDSNATESMPGVRITAICRVANLVGNFYRQKVSLVLTNESSNEYYIGGAEAKCLALDYQIGQMSVKADRVLEPGQTIVLDGVAENMNAKGTDLLPQLRDAICTAAGKKLITSCPKLNIAGDLLKANIKVYWRNTQSGDALKEYYVNGLSGVLRYCGEASLN